MQIVRLEKADYYTLIKESPKRIPIAFHWPRKVNAYNSRSLTKTNKHTQSPFIGQEKWTRTITVYWLRQVNAFDHRSLAKKSERVQFSFTSLIKWMRSITFTWKDGSACKCTVCKRRLVLSIISYYVAKHNTLFNNNDLKKFLNELKRTWASNTKMWTRSIFTHFTGEKTWIQIWL